MEADKAAFSLKWTQTCPTTYERALDDFEKFFAFIGVVGQGRPDKQNWHTTAAIKVETRREDFVGDVNEAWKALRYDYPCLSAVIQDNHWVYHAANRQELSSWLEETFHVHDVERSARQLFPFETNPSQRAVLHVLPRTQELVLQAPHTHVDGIGMATFLHQMLRFLVAPSPVEVAFGNEGANLMPPLCITAQVPKYTPSQKQAWDSNLHNFISQFPTVRVRNENAGARATKAKVQWLTFTLEETTRIATKSKALGFSVTAAAQAAISLAARIHGQVANTTHATFAIYNAREYIDPSLYPHSKLVGPHVFSMPAVFPIIPDSFVETARLARQVFVDYKKDDLLRTVSPFWATDIPSALSASLPPDMPVAADLQLSSVGIIDKYLDTIYRSSGQESGEGRPQIEVQDFWISLDMLSPNVAVEMWTFRGKLVIELTYNEAFHREESITLLLGLIQEQLAQGLGVDLGFDAMAPGEEEFMKIEKGSGIETGSGTGISGHNTFDSGKMASVSHVEANVIV
jgi:hypothetical protein